MQIKSPSPQARETQRSKLVFVLATAACLLILAGLVAVRREALMSPIEQAGHVAGRDLDSGPSAAKSADFAAEAETRRRISDVYGKLPMSFEANEGQTDARVKFLARGDGYGLFLTSEEFVLRLRGDAKEAGSVSGVAAHAVKTAKVSMRLEGANPGAQPFGVRELPGRVNYLKGRDEGKWRRDVRSFAAVRYEGVYEGVDLIFYGNQRQLEYDFVLAPGADPEAIRMKFGGGDRLEVDAGGELVIHTEAGEVRQRKPFVYQEVAGERREVAGAYKLGAGGRVGFRLGEYDPGLPLTIDPVIVYSTYLGANHFEDLTGLAIDAEGNAYITGRCYSVDFPVTAGALKTNIVGSHIDKADAFVTKLNAVGNALIYSTFLGSNSGHEVGMTIAVDPQGHAYVSGLTTSPDFPVTPDAPQRTLGGSNRVPVSDGFVSKLNPAGNALVYSTYLGGDAKDYASDLAIDAAGNAYVTGQTLSTNFPTTPGAYRIARPPHTPPYLHAFVTKINAAGTAFVYSTYLGGGQPEGTNGLTGPYVAVDSSGNAHIAGWTLANDFPTTPGAFQTVKGTGSAEAGDGYYSKLSPDGSTLLYSTFLSGNRQDRVWALSLDASANAYVAGSTNSSDFPVTPGVFKTTLGGDSTSTSGFVTKFNPAGQVVYSTYLGAPTSPENNIFTIAVNLSGEVWVVGNANDAVNFPVTADAHRSEAHPLGDAYLLRLSADGSTLLYSTLFGGIRNEYISQVALDNAGGIYIAGGTSSDDLPVTPGSFQTSLSRSSGASLFITKFGAAPATGHSIGGRVMDGTNPIAGLMIRLGGALEGTQWTKADGTYSFGSLPAGGNYTVTALTSLYDFGTHSRVFDNLSGNETANFVTTASRFRISGQVKDINGSAISDVSITLYPGGTVGNTTIQTDADGRYSFDNLPATNYYSVSAAKGNYIFPPFAYRFKNLIADVTGADFTGLLPYNIHGRLLDTCGAPIPRIRVDLAHTTIVGSRFTVSMQTDSLGNYSFINATPLVTYTLTPISLDHSFAPASYTFDHLNANRTFDFTGTPAKPVYVSTINFAADGFVASEGGAATLTLTRTGDLSVPASVEFSTTDDPAATPCDPTLKRPDGTSYPQGTAYARCDYATTLDTVTFAPGESQRTINVPLIDDAHPEGAETLQVKLLNSTCALLGTRSTATLTINDNNDVPGTANPIFSTPFFVRMHYLDFLSREPEASEPWSGILNGCANPFNLDPQQLAAGCDRIKVSHSFFGAPEFRLKGFYAFTFYRVAFNRRPTYEEIIPDMRSVSGATTEEVYRKRATLPVNFTKRSEFKGLYDALTDAAFVNTLLDRYGLQAITSPDPANPEGQTKVVLTRTDLINRLGSSGTQTLTRAQVLRAVVESTGVAAAEYRQAFVAMQYYGYLRRTPEEEGYQAWLKVIDQDPDNIRIMVDGFMNSTEYRMRFGQP